MKTRTTLVALLVVLGVSACREKSGWVPLPNNYFRAGDSAREKLRHALTQLEAIPVPAPGQMDFWAAYELLSQGKALGAAFVAPNDASTGIASVCVRMLAPQQSPPHHDASRDAKTPGKRVPTWMFKIVLPAEIIVVDRELEERRMNGLNLRIDLVDEEGLQVADCQSQISFDYFEEVDLFQEHPAYVASSFEAVRKGEEARDVSLVGRCFEDVDTSREVKGARVRILWRLH